MPYENKVIGRDLKLTKEGDLSISNTGGVETIMSSPNMLQSARNAVLTSRGFFFYNQEFGSILSQLVGQPNTTELRLLAANDVKKTLLNNPKIKAIPEITTKKGKDLDFSIECSLVPAEENTIYNIVFSVKL